jgi:HD superfamily phosphohydrolase
MPDENDVPDTSGGRAGRPREAGSAAGFRGGRGRSSSGDASKRDQISLSALIQEPLAASEQMRCEPEQEFFIPVHGFVMLSDEEVAVVNHPSLQRLGTVYQLGQAYLVYRGATHRRLEHVLGTLHVAQWMIDAIAANHRRARRGVAEVGESPLGEPLSTVEQVFVRLAALLHDVGHLPEGHTLEDELGFLAKHDEMKRLNLVLDRTEWPGGKTKPLRAVLLEHFSKWLPANSTVSPADIVAQIVAKDPPKEHGDATAAIIRVGVCRDLVGNTICADLLDYLHRDWYHIGKPRHFDERLFHYIEIRQHGDGSPKLVISLGRRPKIRTDAVSAILNLLEARYELAESVLFHRTKCSAAAMLERSLHELWEGVPEDQRESWRDKLEERLLDLGDEAALDHLLNEAESHSADAAVLTLKALRQRELYRGVSTTFWAEIPGDVAQRLLHTYKESGSAAAARIRAVRMLEQDFRLPHGSLAMYCPGKGMNAKVAQVKIHVGGWIETLADWDKQNKDFTGGHLDAQLNRFQRLWRIHVCLHQDEWNRLGDDLLQQLRQAIQVCVLGVSLPQIPIEASVRTVARALTMIEGSPYHDEVVEAELVGARGAAPALVYPSGAPSIGSYFAGA